MITPEPPAGSEHYREGWRHGYEQAAIDRERSADAVKLVPEAEVIERLRQLPTCDPSATYARIAAGSVPDTGQARADRLADGIRRFADDCKLLLDFGGLDNRVARSIAQQERNLRALLAADSTPEPSGDTGQAREPVITFDDEVVWLGRRYVAALNAVLCAPPGSNDFDRWRGHAEAYRQVAEQICRDLNRPAPPFGSEEWRAANGIYSEEYLAELREIVRRSGGPSGDTDQAPDVAARVAALADRKAANAERLFADWEKATDEKARITLFAKAGSERYHAEQLRALLGTDTTPEAGRA